MVKLEYKSNFDEVAKLLADAGEAAIRFTEHELGAIGEEVATIAQARAHKYSKEVEVESNMVTPREVQVVGSSGDSPIARLLEEGNKDKPLSAKTFRHPLFGDDQHWYEQKKHPYLRPAWAAIRPRVHDELVFKQAEAIRAHGFPVEVV